jgi:hypothetical protein
MPLRKDQIRIGAIVTRSPLSGWTEAFVGARLKITKIIDGGFLAVQLESVNYGFGSTDINHQYHFTNESHLERMHLVVTRKDMRPEWY